VGSERACSVSGQPLLGRRAPGWPWAGQPGPAPGGEGMSGCLRFGAVCRGCETRDLPAVRKQFAHPPVFSTDSPTLLALGWGVIATWWVGLLLGIPAAFVSKLGSWPKYDAAALIRPVCGLLVAMACAALVAGLAGYFVADAGGVRLVELLRSRVPVAKHSAFLADLWAHLVAYGVGFLGGLTVCGWVLFRRWRMAATMPGTAHGQNKVSPESEVFKDVH
jgi:hypothetical protein